MEHNQLREKNVSGSIIKNEEPAVTAPELALISQYARKEMTAEEVYTFPVVLCDNEVDRDSESFTPAALKELATLFQGKTGIFDHRKTSHGQVMRVYDAAAIADQGRTTALGEPYTMLRAMVYMPRLQKNAELIAEIEAGIKKEVSVSCSMGKQTCSICGKAYYSDACAHHRRKIYDGKTCIVRLEAPQDAYEFSFVAVPAQPGAGVTKSCGEKKQHNKEDNMTEIELRKEHPELISSIERAAVAAATAKAIADERARLMSIEEIAPSIGDGELVKAAMYGENPLTAEQLAYAAMKKTAALGSNVLEQMKKAADDSGANNVGGAPQVGEESRAKTPETLAADGAAMAKEYEEATGGKSDG